MIDLKLLISHGVHYGHQTARWCPKMKPYIWGFKNGIHLINVMKTAQQLEKAAKFLEGVASEGRTILVVGTKKAAQESVRKVAEELQLSYVVHRWVGGTFTNHRQVRKAIANMMNNEEVLSKSDESHYTKKELNLLKKRTGRLQNIVGGIRQMAWPVGAVVVVDVKKEHVVVKEARASGIPVVGFVDTNSNPEDVDYVIPANDDSPRSISLLMNYLGEAIARGQKAVADRPKKQDIVVESIIETLYDDEPLDEESAGKKKGLKAKVKKAVVEVDDVVEERQRAKLTKLVEPKAAPVKAPATEAAPAESAAPVVEKKSVLTKAIKAEAVSTPEKKAVKKPASKSAPEKPE